jgi:hypothetical protein
MALFPFPIPPNFSTKTPITGLPSLRAAYAGITPGRRFPVDLGIPIVSAKNPQGTNLANAEVYL